MDRGTAPIPEASLTIDAPVSDILDSPHAGPRAIRGGAIRTIGHFAGLALALLAAPFLTRHLGVADYGSYVVVLSLLAIATIFADAGLTTVGIREYGLRDARDRNTMLRSLVSARIAVSAIAGAGAVVFAFLAGYDSVLVVGTAMGAVGLVLTIVQHTYAVPLWAELRITLPASLELLRQVLTVAGILLLVFTGAGLAAFFVLPIPVGIVTLTATLVAVKGYGTLRPVIQSEDWRRLAAQALPFAAASMLGAIFYRVAIVMTSLISSADETGYFGVSMRIVEFVIGVPTIIVVTAFPILARAADTDRQRLASAFQQLFDVLVVLSLWTAFGLVVGAQPAIAFLGGPDFAPAVPVLEIQGCAVAVTFFVTLFIYMLWALRATRHLVAVNLMGVCAAVVLTGALVPEWGARGAAIGMLIAESLLALSLGIALLGARPELRPSLRTLAKALVALCVAAAVALLPVAPLIAVVLGSAAYLAILLALGAIPRDAWRAMYASRTPA